MLSSISYVWRLEYFLESALLNSCLDLMKVFKILFSLDNGFENILFVNFIAYWVVPDNRFEIDK